MILLGEKPLPCGMGALGALEKADNVVLYDTAPGSALARPGPTSATQPRPDTHPYCISSPRPRRPRACPRHPRLRCDAPPGTARCGPRLQYAPRPQFILGSTQGRQKSRCTGYLNPWPCSRERDSRSEALFCLDPFPTSNVFSKRCLIGNDSRTKYVVILRTIFVETERYFTYENDPHRAETTTIAKKISGLCVVTLR